MRGRIDGLIVMAPDVDAPAAHPHLGRHDFPIVLLDPERRGRGLRLALDRQLRRRLRAGPPPDRGSGTGASRSITGPDGNVDARERLRGYRAALAEGGGVAARELEMRGDFTEPSGYAAARALLGLEPRPTAVFAANDYMAIGCDAARCARRASRVPDGHRGGRLRRHRDGALPEPAAHHGARGHRSISVSGRCTC